MLTISRPSASRSRLRSVIGVSVLVSCGALLSTGGCTAEEGAPQNGAGTFSGSGSAGGPTGSGGARSSGGSTSLPSGGATTTVGGSGNGGALIGNGGSSGGTVIGNGGNSAGGSGGGIANLGGTGTGGKPCVDVEPPPDPKWPGATCQNWANETTECAAGWFSLYCDASCGRCVPAGGGANGGSGGASNGGTGAGGKGNATGGKACVDVEPPPDPKWPGATCQTWATESTECKADWFASYCDVSCGRCTPPGGGGGAGGGGAGAPAVVDCSALPNVTGGNGFATRYWDCCQPHCAQFDGHRCGENGIQSTGDQKSACDGGGSFACYDESPRAVSDCLSYGHIAKANPNCGGCYRIQFTGEGQHNVNDPGSKAIQGKQMIVKVTNTGSDVAGNQFDLMVPGGGVGQFNACSRQWGTTDLGAQYGGFLTECTGTHAVKKDCVRQECMKIPAGPARDGCIWFVEWFQVADNPKFTSQSVQCPF